MLNIFMTTSGKYLDEPTIFPLSFHIFLSLLIFINLKELKMGSYLTDVKTIELGDLELRSVMMNSYLKTELTEVEQKFVI